LISFVVNLWLLLGYLAVDPFFDIPTRGGAKGRCCCDARLAFEGEGGEDGGGGGGGGGFFLAAFLSILACFAAASFAAFATVLAWVKPPIASFTHASCSLTSVLQWLRASSSEAGMMVSDTSS
jgi:hypothetical protein